MWQIKRENATLTTVGAGPTPLGAFMSRAPEITACAPQTRNVPLQARVVLQRK